MMVKLNLIKNINKILQFMEGIIIWSGTSSSSCNNGTAFIIEMNRNMNKTKILFSLIMVSSQLNQIITSSFENTYESN